MNPTQLSPEEKKQKRKEYMKEYMRDWKRKKYSENPEKFLRYNKSRYLAKKEELKPEESRKYGEYLHSFKSATELLTLLTNDRPDLLTEAVKLSGAFEKLNLSQEKSQMV
jgi:hypothetical protein